MKIFHALKDLMEYRRRHLPFVKTLEDQDILRVIGFHQEAGDPITLNVLYLQGISSIATIQRRLARLKRLGVVHESRAAHDKRLVKLTLSATVFRLYSGMYAALGTRRKASAKSPRSTGRSGRRERV